MKMSSRMIMTTGIVALFAVLSMETAEAQRFWGRGGKRADRRQSEASADVTQGELAMMLVRELGLSRFLPPGASEMDAIALLIQNGVEPSNGWQPGETVVLADLAVVIVKAMGAQDEVGDVNDAEQAIAYLGSIGIVIETVRGSARGVPPSTDERSPSAVAPVFSTDPLRGDARVALGEIVRIIAAIPDIPRQPTPVTPD